MLSRNHADDDLADLFLNDLQLPDLISVGAIAADLRTPIQRRSQHNEGGDSSTIGQCDKVMDALRSLQDQLSKIESAMQENDSDQLKSILDTAQNHFQSLIQ